MYSAPLYFSTVIFLAASISSFGQGQKTFHYNDGTQQTTGAPKAHYSWDDKPSGNKVNSTREENRRSTRTSNDVSETPFVTVNANIIEDAKKTGNLNVSTFRNGDPIPEAKTNEEWIKASNAHAPAWCYFKNDPANGSKYGKIYNWYAVNDSRGLAPKGYHIPTINEWGGIIHYYGGESEAGKKMKSVEGWEKNGNGIDANGFAILPAGYRFVSDGSFLAWGYYGMQWSSTQKDGENAWVYFLSVADAKATRSDYNKGTGMSCRYIQD